MHQVKFFWICLVYVFYFCTCSSEIRELDRSEHRIEIRFECDEFEDSFYYPTPRLESKDLLTVMGEMSLKENPSIRFISTNQSVEIMEVNGRKTSWKEVWFIYLNGKKISSFDLKNGVRVGEKDTIKIRLEFTERVFGQPTKHGEGKD